MHESAVVVVVQSSYQHIAAKNKLREGNEGIEGSKWNQITYKNHLCPHVRLVLDHALKPPILLCNSTNEAKEENENRNGNGKKPNNNMFVTLQVVPQVVEFMCTYDLLGW
jgi:hypothetical protein